MEIKFRFLANMVDAEGGEDSAMVAKAKGVWKSSESCLLLTHIEEICESVFRSHETWPMKAEPVTKLEGQRWNVIMMYETSLKDGMESTERIGVDMIGNVVDRNKFG